MFNRCRMILACLVVLTSGLGKAEESIQLFNGKDLSGWVAEGVTEYNDPDGKSLPVWTVQDSLISCAGKGFGFLRYAKREFGDFAFHVEYRMAPKCNSGIGIRTVVFDPKKSKDSRPSYASYEIQLMDDAGKPPTKHSTGSLYRYVAPRVNAARPAPEWNTLDIDCVGPLIRIHLNGQEVLAVDQRTVDEIKNKPLRGYVSLQNHGGKIEFRNLRIQEKTAAPGRLP